MAKFDSKSFNERAFGQYMSAVPNVKLNKLRESRAIIGDARLRKLLRTTPRQEQSMRQFHFLD